LLAFEVLKNLNGGQYKEFLSHILLFAQADCLPDPADIFAFLRVSWRAPDVP
jgi:hypothetical protein